MFIELNRRVPTTRNNWFCCSYYSSQLFFVSLFSGPGCIEIKWFRALFQLHRKLLMGYSPHSLQTLPSPKQIVKFKLDNINFYRRSVGLLWIFFFYQSPITVYENYSCLFNYFSRILSLPVSYYDNYIRNPDIRGNFVTIYFKCKSSHGKIKRFEMRPGMKLELPTFRRAFAKENQILPLQVCRNPNDNMILCEIYKCSRYFLHILFSFTYDETRLYRFYNRVFSEHLKVAFSIRKIVVE